MLLKEKALSTVGPGDPTRTPASKHGAGRPRTARGDSGHGPGSKSHKRKR